jgi:chromosome segregation ATPase
MCNAPAQSFVKLFLGEGLKNQPNASSGAVTTSKLSKKKDALPRLPFCRMTTPPRSGNSSSSNNNSNSNSTGEDESILVLALTCHDSAQRLDRVKDKLHRYKTANQTLEQRLETERLRRQQAQDDQERLSTQLNQTCDKHSKERRVWKRQQRRLQVDLDETKEENAILKASLDHTLDQKERDKELLKRQHQKMQQDLKLAEQGVFGLAQDLSKTKVTHQQDKEEWKRQQQQLEQKLAWSKEETQLFMTEIDRTVELHVEERREERRSWEQRYKLLEEELALARKDLASATGNPSQNEK